jgi:TatD DNase family protein
MIDTHAHLDFENFDKDREEVISRFFESGGTAIINIGVDLETSKKSISLAEKHENIFAAVGFHPHDAEESLNFPSEGDFAELKIIAKYKKVVAIGEIGLDYSRFKEEHQIKKQKELLIKQLDIAAELNLPVVIHCREAWEDLYDIISKFKIRNSKFVLHCYSGDKKDTKKFLELPGVSFSFSGNITYPKPIEQAEKLAEAVRMIPLERIMLDSDSPFLAPQEYRGKRNEPAYVRYIARKIAEIKGISAEEAEKATDVNAKNFFGVGS